MILSQPEARVEINPRSEGSVVVIGDAYGQSGRPLAEILASLSWDDPWPGLDEIGGRHAILLLSGSDLRVAHDAFGSRALFYCPGRRAIASHAVLLAESYGLTPSARTAEFMGLAEYAQRKVKYLPGDLTVFDGLYALAPNNFWDGTRTHRYWPRAPRRVWYWPRARPRRVTRPEDFVTAARGYLAAFRDFVAARYRPVFGITGGMDSRVVYAPFGSDFSGVTWAQFLRAEERPAVRAIVAHLGIRHVWLQTKGLEPGPIARAAARASGGFRPAMALYEAMAAACPAADAAFVRGYGGEILRGFRAYRAMPSDPGPAAMTHFYGSSLRPEAGDPSRAYQTFCAAAFEGFRERANWEGLARHGFRAADLFYWEHRMGMWGASMLAEMDPAVHSLVGLNSRPLYAMAFGLPNKVRFSKESLRAVVRSYDSDLADIPYF